MLSDTQGLSAGPVDVQASQTGSISTWLDNITPHPPALGLTTYSISPAPHTAWLECGVVSFYPRRCQESVPVLIMHPVVLRDFARPSDIKPLRDKVQWIAEFEMLAVYRVDVVLERRFPENLSPDHGPRESASCCARSIDLAGLR